MNTECMVPHGANQTGNRIILPPSNNKKEDDEDWQINLTRSPYRVKLFYITQCYDRPVPQFMPKCHRVHIEREGQCEPGKLENA